MLKALNVGGRRVNLGDLFPQGVPGSTGAKESQEAYENFLTETLGIDKDKLKPSDRQTRFTKGLQTLTDFALPSLFGLGQDVKKDWQHLIQVVLNLHLQ